MIFAFARKKDNFINRGFLGTNLLTGGEFSSHLIDFFKKTNKSIRKIKLKKNIKTEKKTNKNEINFYENNFY